MFVRMEPASHVATGDAVLTDQVTAEVVIAATTEIAPVAVVHEHHRADPVHRRRHVAVAADHRAQHHPAQEGQDVRVASVSTPLAPFTAAFPTPPTFPTATSITTTTPITAPSLFMSGRSTPPFAAISPTVGQGRRHQAAAHEACQDERHDRASHSIRHFRSPPSRPWIRRRPSPAAGHERGNAGGVPADSRKGDPAGSLVSRCRAMTGSRIRADRPGAARGNSLALSRRRAGSVAKVTHLGFPPGSFC